MSLGFVSKGLKQFHGMVIQSENGYSMVIPQAQVQYTRDKQNHKYMRSLHINFHVQTQGLSW